jgi:hypothetical protein
MNLDGQVDDFFVDAESVPNQLRRQFGIMGQQAEAQA